MELCGRLHADVEALSVRLSDFKVLSFDCYGTLIDWESGMLASLEGLTNPLGLTRNEILQAHATHEAAQQAQTPTKRYSDVLATVYKRLAEHWGVPASHEDCVAYGRSIGDWPAFSDTVEALRYLKRFYKLVILSNVDNASFEGSKLRLGVTFDAVVTAEDAGSYKPDRRNFDYMLERLQGGLADKPDILHTAESLFHDHVTATGNRPRHLLDPSAARRYRVWRDQGTAADAAGRFPVHQHGRDGRGAPGGDARLEREEFAFAHSSRSKSLFWRAA